MAEEYSKFTITSKKDRYSHGYDIPDYERDMKTIVNQAVKSALSEGGYFKTSSRVVDKTTGETKLDIYVHTADAKVVEDSIKNELNKLTFRDSKGRVTQRPKYKVDSDTLSDKEQRTLAREEAKSETEVARFNKGALLKIIGVITLIADISRRILSAVMTFSQQTVKDMVTAHNLGMSYESVRHYRHLETAHGMQEGTITNAVADIQSKFGNITSLDEKALEALAVVMGSKIEDMAKMGIGASNPEAVLGAILDSFNEKANAGYNSVGQYVGEAQARRELYSYLLKVSPQVADIFATMQEEQHNINSIYRYQASTFEKFSNMRSTKRGGNGDLEYGITETLGETWNQLLDTVNQIKEAFVVQFAPTLLALTRRLADTRIGMTEEEKRQRNKENKEANAEALEATKKTMKYYEDKGLNNLSPEDRAYYMALQQYAKDLEKENSKKTIHNLVKTYGELKLEGKSYLGNVDIYSRNLALKGMGFGLGDIGATDEEIQDVVEAYNYDTPEERAKYKKYAEDYNKEAVDTIRKLDSQATRQEFVDKAKEARLKIESEKSDKNSIVYAKRKSLGASNRGAFDDLLVAYEIYDIAYDLSTWDNNTYNELYTRLHELVKEGLISQSKFGNYEGVMLNPDRFKQSQESKDRIRASVPFLTFAGDDYENSYLQWLYENNMDAMNDSILAKRVDEQADSYEQARFADMLNILYGTEGAKNDLDWRRRVPKKLGDSAKLYSVPDDSNGEKRLRFVLEIKDGKKTTTVDVANILNASGVEAYLGDVVWDTETKQPLLNVNMADGASTMK